LLGFVLLGIYLLGAGWEYFALREDCFENILQKINAAKRSQRLMLIGVLSALATLANPYGWKLHVHIYRYLSNRFLMNHIDEFQSPDFHRVAQKCFAALLMLSVVALAIRAHDKTRIRPSQVRPNEVHPSKVRPSEVLIILFAVYSGLYASRNIPVSALLLILIIGPRLSDAVQRFTHRSTRSASQTATSPGFFLRMQEIETSLHGHIWPVVAIVFTSWIAFHGGYLGAKPMMTAHFDPQRFPADAVTYFETRKLQGPVFAPDFWGGYVIYRLYPQIRVAVDDRHDFYGEQFLRSYLKLVHVEPGWEKFLADHSVRCVVISKDSALASILTETPGWQPIYSDHVAVIFVPAKPVIP
jgi:hypothetical protein